MAQKGDLFILPEIISHGNCFTIFLFKNGYYNLSIVLCTYGCSQLFCPIFTKGVLCIQNTNIIYKFPVNILPTKLSVYFVQGLSLFRSHHECSFGFCFQSKERGSEGWQWYRKGFCQLPIGVSDKSFFR